MTHPANSASARRRHEKALDGAPITAEGIEPTGNQQGSSTVSVTTSTVADQVRAILDTARTAEHQARQLNVTALELPGDAPALAVIDLGAAAAHLRTAARILDRAAQQVSEVAGDDR